MDLNETRWQVWPLDGEMSGRCIIASEDGEHEISDVLDVRIASEIVRAHNKDIENWHAMAWRILNYHLLTNL